MNTNALFVFMALIGGPVLCIVVILIVGKQPNEQSQKHWRKQND